MNKFKDKTNPMRLKGPTQKDLWSQKDKACCIYCGKVICPVHVNHLKQMHRRREHMKRCAAYKQNRHAFVVSPKNKVNKVVFVNDDINPRKYKR